MSLDYAYQPPSGGCVLKQKTPITTDGVLYPAAFGRLCVETGAGLDCTALPSPAAFGRLCVETGEFG